MRTATDSALAQPIRREPEITDVPDDTKAAASSATDDAPQRAAAKSGRISISIRTLAVGAGLVVLIVALDYAVNAAIMDYKDLGPWKQNLIKGTTPELSDKLTKAATAMDQILLPLQWKSTARPLAAQVRSDSNGVYIVDAFVGVTTRTVQAAEGVESTATYSTTIDSNNAWRITDVGGIDTVVGGK